MTVYATLWLLYRSACSRRCKFLFAPVCLLWIKVTLTIVTWKCVFVKTELLSDGNRRDRFARTRSEVARSHGLSLRGVRTTSDMSEADGPSNFTSMHTRLPTSRRDARRLHSMKRWLSSLSYWQTYHLAANLSSSAGGQADHHWVE